MLAEESGDDTNICGVLNALFSFFKLSTGRREDLINLRGAMMEDQDDFEESLDQFFLRHVDTRLVTPVISKQET